MNLTPAEIDAIAAFLTTLAGTDVYTNEKWSDPFDENGNITILGGSVTTSVDESEEIEFNIYPNPASDYLNLSISGGSDISNVLIYDNSGRMVRELSPSSYDKSLIQIEVFSLPVGVYHLAVLDDSKKLHSKRFVVIR